MLWLLFRNGSEGVRFRTLYIAFCLGYFSLNLASLVVPFFAAQLNTWRIYHLTLIVLSPLVIIGGTYIIKFFTQRRAQFSRVPLTLISIFLTIFLLLTLLGSMDLLTNIPNPFALWHSIKIQLHKGMTSEGVNYILHITSIRMSIV